MYWTHVRPLRPPAGAPVLSCPVTEGGFCPGGVMTGHPKRQIGGTHPKPIVQR